MPLKKDLTVIMPYYKKIKYFKKAYSSIINQTYKNFNIILVYDDEFKEDLKKIKKIIKTKNFKYIVNKKNIGVGPSRNKAINVAKTKYIAFLDCDDYYDSNKITNSINYIQKNNFQFIYTNVFLIDFNRNILKNSNQLNKIGEGDIAKQIILKFSRISDIIFLTKDDINNLDFKNYKNIIKKNFKNKITIFRSGNGDVEVYNKSYFEKYKFNLNKNVKDTTGCGDAFNACFLFNYFTNKKIEKCLELAHQLGKTVANFKGAIIDKKDFNPKFYAN